MRKTVGFCDVGGSTAGKLAAAQATKMKTGLTARVTAMVESVPGPKLGGMGKDRMGKGKKMHS